MKNSLDEINLRSEEVQDILTSMPNWMIRWGSMLFLLLIFLLLSISWFIKYPDIIEAQAFVTTAPPPQNEYANLSARIDTIYVEDSQNVEKNQVLAILENAAISDDVFYLKSIVDTTQFGRNSTIFPIDEFPLLFLGEIEQSFAQFENDYTQYTLNLELQAFPNEAIANNITLSKLKSRLQSTLAQHVLKKSELGFKKKELDRNKILFEKRVISEQDLENKQLEMLIAERDYKNLGIVISQIRESIDHAKKTTKGTEITKNWEETKLLKRVGQSFNQLKKAIRDWEYKYVLKSEIEGKVSFLSYWNKNQTVSQGDLVFTIIPSNNESYVAKIKAPSQKSGKIKIGQYVNIKLQNYPETEFGILLGKVKNISLTPDKEGFYLVDVSLPQKLVTSYGKQIEFRQEMRGIAEIITEDLRLLERFFHQFKEILSR